MVVLLKHYVELGEGCRPAANPRLVAALEAVMENPQLTNSELAIQAKTTEKQIARMGDVFAIQRVWRFRQASATNEDSLFGNRRCSTTLKKRASDPGSTLRQNR